MPDLGQVWPDDGQIRLTCAKSSQSRLEPGKNQIKLDQMRPSFVMRWRRQEMSPRAWRHHFKFPSPSLRSPTTEACATRLLPPLMKQSRRCCSTRLEGQQPGTIKFLETLSYISQADISRYPSTSCRSPGGVFVADRHILDNDRHMLDGPRPRFVTKMVGQPRGPSYFGRDLEQGRGGGRLRETFVVLVWRLTGPSQPTRFLGGIRKPSKGLTTHVGATKGSPCRWCES